MGGETATTLEAEQVALIQQGKEQVASEVWDSISEALSGQIGQEPIYSVVNSSIGAEDAYSN